MDYEISVWKDDSVLNTLMLLRRTSIAESVSPVTKQSLEVSIKNLIKSAQTGLLRDSSKTLKRPDLANVSS